jgi:hypothetical protein
VLALPRSSWCGITRGTVLNAGQQDSPAAQQRRHLHLGIGRAQMGRVEMFRVQSGVAVTMEQRVYEVPSVPQGVLRCGQRAVNGTWCAWLLRLLTLHSPSP